MYCSHSRGIGEYTHEEVSPRIGETPIGSSPVFHIPAWHPRGVAAWGAQLPQHTRQTAAARLPRLCPPVGYTQSYKSNRAIQRAAKPTTPSKNRVMELDSVFYTRQVYTRKNAILAMEPSVDSPPDAVARWCTRVAMRNPKSAARSCCASAAAASFRLASESREPSCCASVPPSHLGCQGGSSCATRFLESEDVWGPTVLLRNIRTTTRNWPSSVLGFWG